MAKKNLVKAALLAAAALTISACGKQAETQDAAQTTAADSSASESGAETEAGEDGADAPDTTSADTAAMDAEIEELKNVKRPASLGTVKLGNYDGIEINAAKPYTVTDADVDSYLSYYILPSYIEPVDDAAKNGDTVNIDYVGKQNGVAFEGGTASGSDLVLGSGSFIDGFEDGLIGHKKGETVTLSLTFPEDYFNKELAGAAVTFDVKINEVKRTPELTDGLAAEIDPEVTTAAAYREKLKGQLQEQEDYMEDQDISYQAIKAVVDSSELEPSEEAIDWKVADLIANYYEQSMQSMYGMGLSQILSMQGQTLDDFKSDIREVAEETIRQLLVMDEIVKEQNITVGEEELNEFAESNRLTLDALRQSAEEEDIKLAAEEYFATKYVVDHAKISYTEDASVEDAALAEAESAEAE